MSRALVLAAAVGLSGCMEGVPQAASVDVPARVAVAEGLIIVAGPRGYCVDLGASRDTAEGALVVLGSCAAIAQDPALPQPDMAAVLTAAVSAPGRGMKVRESAAALGQYFRSDGGRAALARSGRAADVTILEDFSRGGAYYLRLRDVGAAPGPAFEPDYWRALIDIGDRIITLSVLAPKGRPISRDDGLETLSGFLQRILSENRGIMAGNTLRADVGVDTG
ncbi:hypothetical protein ACFQXB_16785 [Plastorhodobacter daqingensis]|uniref:Dihydroxy-acid dehydratase n=1 Tax=Plastorhodobacter daqingensis TaxID=1387281 RepID=A0ABW2UQY4_9RHOB